MDYKRNTVRLGGSDIATLIINDTEISMGSDGNYKGYVIFDDNEIPDHYEYVDIFEDSLTICDDHEVVFEADCGATIFKAGDLTLMIVLDEKNSVSKCLETFKFQPEEVLI